jgi:hypothetical protein
VPKNSSSARHRRRFGYWLAVAVACYAAAGAVVLCGVAALPQRVQVGVGDAAVAWGVLGLAVAGVGVAGVRARKRGSVAADLQGRQEAGRG